MNFSGNVDNGSRNRKLHFGDVQDSGGTLTFDLKKNKMIDLLYRSMQAPEISLSI